MKKALRVLVVEDSQDDALLVLRTLRQAGYEPSFERVANNCAFMRHWKENAATLTEPEWYAGLGIVARCADGVTLAHEISKDYPGYSRIETDAKITHALEGAGPRTCATLRKEFPVCAGCPIASEGCVSPISLGHKPTAQELQLMVDLVLTSPGSTAATASGATASTGRRTATWRTATGR